jgi:hypothetical protein
MFLKIEIQFLCTRHNSRYCQKIILFNFMISLSLSVKYIFERLSTNVQYLDNREKVQTVYVGGPGLTVDGLRSVVDLMYTGLLRIDPTNVWDILTAADILLLAETRKTILERGDIQQKYVLYFWTIKDPPRPPPTHTPCVVYLCHLRRLFKMSLENKDPPEPHYPPNVPNCV